MFLFQCGKKERLPKTRKINHFLTSTAGIFELWVSLSPSYKISLGPLSSHTHKSHHMLSLRIVSSTFLDRSASNRIFSQTGTRTFVSHPSSFLALVTLLPAPHNERETGMGFTPKLCNWFSLSPTLDCAKNNLLLASLLSLICHRWILSQLFFFSYALSQRQKERGRGRSNSGVADCKRRNLKWEKKGEEREREIRPDDR